MARPKLKRFIFLQKQIERKRIELSKLLSELEAERKAVTATGLPIIEAKRVVYRKGGERSMPFIEYDCPVCGMVEKIGNAGLRRCLSDTCNGKTRLLLIITSSEERQREL